MLLDFSKEELIDYVVKLGFPKFRGSQLFDALMQGKRLDEITNLPKNFLDKIKDEYPNFYIEKKLESKDGTKKYAYRLKDGQIIEGVFMKYKYGNTLCVSTQVGCRMGCKFCASGLFGLTRNLTAGEILEQVIIANKDNRKSLDERSITNVVLMGSGEPLDNYENVTKFIKLLNSENGLNISQRNISLSTCGIVPYIYKLADDGFTVTLTISLHASNDEVRKKTMPIANKYSIKEIIDACKYYFKKTGRRVVFEYTLVKDVNDKEIHIKELSKLLKGLSCHVNVIPLNFVKERGLLASGDKATYNFAESLVKNGVSATVRRTLGSDIGGACGQLRNSLVKNNNSN